jgi:hypothetical protein
VNLYIVTEGVCEKEVYPSWISLINPSLVQVEGIAQIVNNNYAIISGGGFPGYFTVIENAILEVNDHGNINRLVITIDSEDLTRQEAYRMVDEFVTLRPCSTRVCIVVQHFCMETWALGNRTIIRRHTNHPKLREYKSVHDVILNDPELLPEYQDMNRSQFALRYLRACINDRYSSLTYSKRNPKILTQQGYFYQMKQRLIDTGHISSLKSFIDAFT